jgi:hypothetical protein
MDALRRKAQCHAPLLHKAQRQQTRDIAPRNILDVRIACVGNLDKRDCLLRAEVGKRIGCHCYSRNARLGRQLDIHEATAPVTNAGCRPQRVDNTRIVGLEQICGRAAGLTLIT